jgi:UDP-2,3-diacylglucosamine hydrolase
MIAIFAGSGHLPKEIFSSLYLKKKKFIILNLSNKNYKNSIKIKLGQFGKIIKILKNNKVKEVIFAGHVKRPRLEDMKLDLKAISYLPKLLNAFKRGDGNILNLAKSILRENKIKVIASHKYTKNLLLNKLITKSKPNNIDLKDYKKGSKILKALSKFDNAQGVIVDNGYILAIEAAEGTDEMLKRVIKLRSFKQKPSGVLIKLPKDKQSLNYDLPTIGFNTINLCVKLKLKGIFLKKNKNIFLNQKKSIDLANKNNLFISPMK